MSIYEQIQISKYNKLLKQIEELNKSSLVKTAYVTKRDLPELIVPYLIYLLPILFILDWRVRIWK